MDAVTWSVRLGDKEAPEQDQRLSTCFNQNERNVLRLIRRQNASRHLALRSSDFFTDGVRRFALRTLL